MRLEVIHGTDNEYREDIVDLLCVVDDHATGNHYEMSTARLARAMFPEHSFTSNREALAGFYDEMTDYVVLAFQGDELVGCSLLETHENTSVDDDYTPALFVSFSAVHPDHQRQGVWTEMRKEAEALGQDLTVDYLLTTVEEENEASLQANKSRDMEIVYRKHEQVLFALPLSD